MLTQKNPKKTSRYTKIGKLALVFFLVFFGFFFGFLEFPNWHCFFWFFLGFLVFFGFFLARIRNWKLIFFGFFRFFWFFFGLGLGQHHSCQTALLSAGRSSLPCFTPFRESRTPQKKGIFENIPIKFKIYLKFSRKHKIVGIFGKIYPRCTRVKWNIRKIYPIYTRVEWTFSKLSYLRYTIYPKNISNLH